MDSSEINDLSTSSIEVFVVIGTAKFTLSNDQLVNVLVAAFHLYASVTSHQRPVAGRKNVYLGFVWNDNMSGWYLPTFRSLNSLHLGRVVRRISKSY